MIGMPRLSLLNVCARHLVPAHDFEPRCSCEGIEDDSQSQTFSDLLPPSLSRRPIQVIAGHRECARNGRQPKISTHAHSNFLEPHPNLTSCPHILLHAFPTWQSQSTNRKAVSKTGLFPHWLVGAFPNLRRHKRGRIHQGGMGRTFPTHTQSEHLLERAADGR